MLALTLCLTASTHLASRAPRLHRFPECSPALPLISRLACRIVVGCCRVTWDCLAHFNNATALATAKSPECSPVLSLTSRRACGTVVGCCRATWAYLARPRSAWSSWEKSSCTRLAHARTCDAQDSPVHAHVLCACVRDRGCVCTLRYASSQSVRDGRARRCCIEDD